jgi:hypothetical protein
MWSRVGLHPHVDLGGSVARREHQQAGAGLGDHLGALDLDGVPQREWSAGTKTSLREPAGKGSPGAVPATGGASAPSPVARSVE